MQQSCVRVCVCYKLKIVCFWRTGEGNNISIILFLKRKRCGWWVDVVCFVFFFLVSLYPERNIEQTRNNHGKHERIRFNVS